MKIKKGNLRPLRHHKGDTIFPFLTGKSLKFEQEKEADICQALSNAARDTFISPLVKSICSNIGLLNPFSVNAGIV